MKEKIKIITKNPGKSAKVKAIPADNPLLARMRDAVPGEVTSDDIPGMPDIYGFSNVSGKSDPNPNVFYPYSRFAGAPGTTACGVLLYAAAPTFEGEMKSLSDEQIGRVTNYIAKNSVESEFEDVFHRVTNFKHYEAARMNKPTQAYIDDLMLLNRVAKSRYGKNLYERAVSVFVPEPGELPRILSSHSIGEVRIAARQLTLKAEADKSLQEKTQRKKAAQVAKAKQETAESFTSEPAVPLRASDFYPYPALMPEIIRDPEYREFVANGGGSLDVYDVGDKTTLQFVRKYSRFIPVNEICLADADGRLIAYFQDISEPTPVGKPEKPTVKKSAIIRSELKKSPPKKPISKPVIKEPKVKILKPTDEVKPVVQVTAYNDFRAWRETHRDEIKSTVAFKANPPKDNGKGK